MLEGITDPTFGATCDNFVIAYVLNVYYEADKTKTFASFKLTKAELNLTFGFQAPIDKEIQITRNLEINWIETKPGVTNNRKNSGSPGYKPIAPLKVGKLTQPDPNKNEYIAEYNNAYALRGAD